MALKDLSTKTMLEITGAWLDADDGDRGVLEGFKEIGGALPWLDRVHVELAVAAAASDEATTEARELTIEMVELDRYHDRKVRGLYHTLTGLAELADDTEEARELLELRAQLFPLGTNITLLSYVEQAAAMEQTRDDMGEDTEDALASLHVGNSSLHDALLAWFDAAGKLKEMMQTRAELKQVSEGDTEDLLNARRAWIGAVGVVAGSIEALEMPELERDKLLGRLRQAERRAATRRVFSRD